MAAAGGKKKLKPKQYSSENLMVRSIGGVGMIALGLLMLLALYGGMNGTIFSMLRTFLFGLAGSLCPVVPVFLCWGGVLVALSSRRRVPCRTILLAMLFCALIMSLLNLLSSCHFQNGNYPFMEYIRLTNKSIYLRANDTEFLYFMGRIFNVCSATKMCGGLIGGLLSWPLWMGLGVTGGAIVNVLCAVITTLLLVRLDFRGIYLKLRDRYDSHEENRAQRMEEKQEAVARQREEAEYARQQAREQQRARVTAAPMPVQEQRSRGFYDEIVHSENKKSPKATEEIPSFYKKKSNAPAPEDAYVPDASSEGIPWEEQPEEQIQPARYGRRDLGVDTYTQNQPAQSAWQHPAQEQQAEEETPVRQSTWQSPAADRQPSALEQAVQQSMNASEQEQPTELTQEDTDDYRAPVYMSRSRAQEKVNMSGKQLDKPDLKLVTPKEEGGITTGYQMPEQYEFPPLSLLKAPVQEVTDTEEQDVQGAAHLEETLHSFGIDGSVQHVTHGPAITRFEVDLPRDVNIKRLFSIEDNIAKDMAAASGIRIEAPIPGTSLVGIEVPNSDVASVTLREVIESKKMKDSPSPLTVALGKDIAGHPVVCDLAKMPHLLIAGATGSGKSVCINSIINSLLYRCTPKDVRLILVDPKVVELQCYNGVPHLLIPVVSDPHKASGALGWAVNEMMDRYAKLEARGVRNIVGYNAALKPGEEKMPYIVVIIDELADLMMACKKEVEESICRIAQLARAAGIHLVVATQRPSVDVITGLIKANIPSRIAFAVSSNIDSRTILDAVGAEKLLGRGDMYFAPMGARVPTRVQGCFVSDGEVNRVADFFRRKFHPAYDQSVLDQLDQREALEKEDASTIDGEEAVRGVDSRLGEAIEMVVRDGQASISMLQRRLGVGYARAGKMVDEMERRGIVGPGQGAKPRQILVTVEELDNIVNNL